MIFFFRTVIQHFWLITPCYTRIFMKSENWRLQHCLLHMFGSQFCDTNDKTKLSPSHSQLIMATLERQGKRRGNHSTPRISDFFFTFFQSYLVTLWMTLINSCQHPQTWQVVCFWPCCSSSWPKDVYKSLLSIFVLLHHQIQFLNCWAASSQCAKITQKVSF